jgi:hypothetical protein
MSEPDGSERDSGWRLLFSESEKDVIRKLSETFEDRNPAFRARRAEYFTGVDAP